MYKVLKDFTTPLHRFKANPENPAHAVIAASDIDGPLGVDYYLQHKFIVLDKPLKTHMIESDKPPLLMSEADLQEKADAKAAVKDNKKP